MADTEATGEDIERKRRAIRRMQDAFDAMPVPCVVKDETWRVVLWNKAAERTFGFEAKEVLGKNPLEFMVASYRRQDVEQSLNRVFGGEIYYHSINENIASDGRTLVVEWHNSVLPDEDGSMLGVLSIGRDITGCVPSDTGLADAPLERGELMDKLRECIFVHDAESGEILDINQRVCDLFGHERDEILSGGVGLLSFREEGYTMDLALEQIRRAAQGTPQLFDWLCRSRSGRVFWVEVQLRQAIVSGTKRVIAVVRDITERKQYEAKARQAILFQAREDFIATLVHDLKTPLTATLGALELLLDGELGGLEKEQRELLSRLGDSNRSLLSMIQNLLEAYRNEQGILDLRLEETDLRPLVGACVQEVAGLARAKQIEMEVSVAESLRLVAVDRLALRRVTLNLLSNAIKYTPAGSQIQVRLSDSGQSVILEVEDAGPGISLDEQGNLFNRFWQGKGSRQQGGIGSGIGLYLCRQIVEAHQGQIACFSREGAGSTFTVILPAA